VYREDDYSVWAALWINDKIRQELAIKRRFLKEIRLKLERNRVKKGALRTARNDLIAASKVAKRMQKVGKGGEYVDGFCWKLREYWRRTVSRQ
jgi:hypothetical protein